MSKSGKGSNSGEGENNNKNSTSKWDSWSYNEDYSVSTKGSISSSIEVEKTSADPEFENFRQDLSKAKFRGDGVGSRPSVQGLFTQNTPSQEEIPDGFSTTNIKVDVNDQAKEAESSIVENANKTERKQEPWEQFISAAYLGSPISKDALAQLKQAGAPDKSFGEKQRPSVKDVFKDDNLLSKSSPAIQKYQDSEHISAPKNKSSSAPILTKRERSNDLKKVIEDSGIDISALKNKMNASSSEKNNDKDNSPSTTPPTKGGGHGRN